MASNTNNRWLATVASMLIQFTSGSSYAFGIYSPLLKSSQDYSQSTLDTISVFKDIGANAGVLSGLLYSAVAYRRRHRSSSSDGGVDCCCSGGPWIVHLAGAVQCFAGYLCMWLSVEGIIDRPVVPVMCLFMFVAAHGQTFYNTANVVTAVQNFPDYSGTAVGIMKGCLGLSGAVLIQGYQTFFNDNPNIFLLMLALLPALVSILLMCTVRTYEVNIRDDKKHLNALSKNIVFLALYLMVIIILENIIALPSWGHVTIFVLLLFLLVSPLKIANKAQREDFEKSAINASSSERNPLIGEAWLLESEKLPQIEHLHTSEKPTFVNTTLQEGDNLNLSQAMRSVNFWLLFIAMACGMGSGLATINNMTQIGESLGYTRVERNTLVSLWSIWNFFGRFGAGYVSDVLLHRKGIARPFLMVITLGIMGAGYVVIACGFPGNLFIGSVIVGVCYGSQWSLMPTITSEIFGVQHMGTIFNSIAIASPIGSYLLSVRVIGYFYDQEASGKDDSCVGTRCFMLSFIVMSSTAFSASFFVFVLYLRTRRFYSLVLARRLQHLT